MIDLDGVFDIECANWDRFRVAATYDGTRTKIHMTRDALVDYLLSRGGTWWAHCGGQYDGLAIADVLDRRSIQAQIDYPRSRMTRVVIGRTILRDSWGLLPFRLDVIAAMAGERKPELPFAHECSCRLKCGGYCRIGAHAPWELNEYVVADCRALYGGLRALIAHCETHRIDLRGTIGGTAWATAQRQLGLPDADLAPTLRARLAIGDHGGRTGLYRPISPGPGTHRDISSAYPAALARCALPVGAPQDLGAKNAASAFSRGLAGIYEATVDVPEAHLPALPMRGRGIYYPFGPIRGVWPANEIDAAVTRGAKVLAVHGGVVWSRSRVLFAPLVEHWYAIRRRAGKSSPFGKWMRELANALTGKFAESSERRTVRMHPTWDQIVICPRAGACRHGCVGACGAWEMLDTWGHLWGQPYYRAAPSGHVQWSAYLRAATRIAWLDEAERHGESIVAGNTDSIWTTARIRSQPEGKALGAWETKNTWVDWEARAYNCYRYRDPLRDRVVIRASGAGTMTDDEWKLGQLERSSGVETLLEAAKHGKGLFRRRRTRYTLPGDQGQEWFGDRKLDASGLVTRAVHVDVLRDRARRAI